MKILTISDQECPGLWEYYTPGKLQEFDLISVYRKPGDLAILRRKTVSGDPEIKRMPVP